MSINSNSKGQSSSNRKKVHVFYDVYSGIKQFYTKEESEILTENNSNKIEPKTPVTSQT